MVFPGFKLLNDDVKKYAKKLEQLTGKVAKKIEKERKKKKRTNKKKRKGGQTGGRVNKRRRRRKSRVEKLGFF